MDADSTYFAITVTSVEQMIKPETKAEYNMGISISYQKQIYSNPLVPHRMFCQTHTKNMTNVWLVCLNERRRDDFFVPKPMY